MIPMILKTDMYKFRTHFKVACDRYTQTHINMCIYVYAETLKSIISITTIYRCGMLNNNIELLKQSFVFIYFLILFIKIFYFIRS